MNGKPNVRFSELCSKYSSFWQSLLRFGLPFILIYYLVNYIIFRVTLKNTGLQYPWKSAVIPDVFFMFLVSAVWWIVMRQFAGRK
ncbi:MAG TPA: hypothetical protein VN788_02650 [Verrucomicrobiae bacterium]|nr:hypothetical protein [Verrucomicrobiae bacterium]